jgi:hypothetical protein
MLHLGHKCWSRKEVYRSEKHNNLLKHIVQHNGKYVIVIVSVIVAFLANIGLGGKLITKLAYYAM